MSVKIEPVGDFIVLKEIATQHQSGLELVTKNTDKTFEVMEIGPNVDLTKVAIVKGDHVWAANFLTYEYSKVRTGEDLVFCKPEHILCIEKESVAVGDPSLN